MRNAMKLLTVLGGGGGVVNTVAPAITTDAVIGTEITGDDGMWTGSPTFTYQWQRNTGSWVNIGGATNKNYTPVDADFGYALRLVVTANGSASANSNATDLTEETPGQALGAELLANGNFANWTGDNPSSWSTVGESGSDPVVTQVAPGGGTGTGACRIFSSATNNEPSIRQTVLSTGTYYEGVFVLDTRTSGTLKFIDSGGGGFTNYASTGTKRQLWRAAGTTVRFEGFTAPTDIVIDDASVKAITLNTQLVAPSANMRISFFYTLPGTPVQNEEVWVMLRISNFSSGNYWLALLTYTGTQWNITLFSVASHTRTPTAAAATNIGATNGIRINMNGDSISLETTANNGGSWLQRGSTISNSLYNTATGVNALIPSTVTAGRLVYETPL